MTLDSDDAIPKRGDLLHTNLGDRRERTWLILRVKRLRPTVAHHRVKVWAERWWQLEPEFRIKLYRSAQRNGGQHVIHTKRYPPKKKRSFEQYMKRGD